MMSGRDTPGVYGVTTEASIDVVVELIRGVIKSTRGLLIIESEALSPFCQKAGSGGIDVRTDGCQAVVFESGRMEIGACGHPGGGTMRMETNRSTVGGTQRMVVKGRGGEGLILEEGGLYTFSKHRRKGAFSHSIGLYPHQQLGKATLTSE